MHYLIAFFAEFHLSKTYSYEMNGEMHYIAAGLPETSDKSAYFKGESVKFFKKQKFITEKKEYNVRMKKAQFIKRDIKDNYSMPLSVSEILQRMQLNNAFSP